MAHILNIAQKDLLQLLRDFKTFLFLLLMPILFTFLFGFAFGGFSSGSDSRLPVGYLDEDQSWVSEQLKFLLNRSEVIRLVQDPSSSHQKLEQMVAEDKLAAAIVVPSRYGKTFLRDRSLRLTVIAKGGSAAWTTVEAALLSAVGRLDSAARTAFIMEEITNGHIPYRYAFDRCLKAWAASPIAVIETKSPALGEEKSSNNALAHTSPGMMLQFAIAGLMTCAQILVGERKSRCLQRMLTTAINRSTILFGHALAFFTLVFGQFLLLIVFAQFILKVNYLRLPLATLVVAFCAALCITALGLLIGTLARNEDQAVIFSLVPMFILAGLGGAWVPLEVTGEAFQRIGHLSPVAWAMDGFKNITLRGLGFNSVLVPAAALVGYAGLFFALAYWRMNRLQEG